MTNEIEIAAQVLTSQTGKLMRDFREIQLQRNHNDRAKTVKALKDLCFKSIAHDLHRLTRHKISDHQIDGMYWFINPLDGAENLMHGLPLFCTSATLMNHDVALASLVHIPITNNIVQCEPAGGLHSNYGLHKVATRLSLADSYIAADCVIPGVNTQNLNCNTLAYIYAAYGNTDGFILDLDPISAKSAELFMKEAGGKFSKIGNKYIGSNVAIHDELRTNMIENMGVKTKTPFISFSCGPTQKAPTWTKDVYDDALIAMSNFAPQGLKRVQQAQELIRYVLQIPKDYKILMVNGSATGAIECAFFNFLGHRPVQNLTYDVFGKRWSKELRRIIDSYQYIANRTIPFYGIDYALEDIRSGQVAKYEEKIDPKKDLVFVYTGTSTGFRWNYNLTRGPDDGLVVCDATSAVFAEDLAWDKLDVTAFSFQKALGAEAGLGCLVLSPKAAEHLQKHKPVFIPPRIMHLTQEVIQNAASGKLINTVSMLNVQEILHNLQWAAHNGGLAFMKARAIANQKLILDNMPDTLELLVENPEYRSNCVVCVRPKDHKLQTWEHIHKVARIAETKFHVYEICGHPEEVPCWRFWTGPTAQNVEEGFSKSVLAGG